LESNLHERGNKLNYGEDKDVLNPSRETTSALRNRRDYFLKVRKWKREGTLGSGFPL